MPEVNFDGRVEARRPLLGAYGVYVRPPVPPHHVLGQLQRVRSRISGTKIGMKQFDKESVLTSSLYRVTHQISDMTTIWGVLIFV